jgi:biotin carboxyl carrier protein
MPQMIALSFGLALVALSLAVPAQAEKRIALVIGNDRYAHLAAEQQLQKAVNDAQAVGEVLSRLGFQVINGTNLGRQGMIDKLAELTTRLDKGDIAAFFFAGHGVAIGGVNYLVPSDVPAVTEGSEARVRGASIAEYDVMDEIHSKGVRVALLVLDACRDNPFPRSGTRAIGNTRGLTNTKPPSGIFTIYSAGVGQTALDRLEPVDPNRNSVFTRVFIEQVGKPGLDLSSLAVEVREQVAELALKAKDGSGRPAPHEQTPAYYDQTLRGRIYLAGLPKSPEPSPTVPDPIPARPAVATPVAFLIAGHITELPVSVGSVVKKGDLIAQIDTRANTAEIAQLQAQTEAVAATYDKAWSEALRSRKSVAGGSVTMQQYESSMRTLQQSEAQLRLLRAQLVDAKDRFSYSQLRVDFDGVVTAVGVEVGYMVAAGQMVVEIARKPNEASDFRQKSKQ